MTALGMKKAKHYSSRVNIKWIKFYKFWLQRNKEKKYTEQMSQNLGDILYTVIKIKHCQFS